MAGAARHAAEPRLLVRTRELPVREGAALQLFESGGAPGGTTPAAAKPHERFYWEQPRQRRAVAALGAAARIETHGTGRFEAAEQALRALALRLEPARDRQAPAPRLVGGFAFADTAAGAGADAGAAVPGAGEWEGFAPLSFVLPSLLYVREDARAWLFAIAPLAPAAGASVEALERALERRLDALAGQLAAPAADAALDRAPACASEYCARPDRPHAAFLALLAAAIDAMRMGRFEKVVLARSLCVDSDVAHDAASLLAALRRTQQASTSFAVARGERVFVGASPERLLRLEGERLWTAAVAGSVARGRAPREDARLARRLRESKKEQEEHAFVVREIEAALAPLCAQLERPEAPRLLALEGIQHLETPFSGRLRDDLDPRPGFFSLAGRLHPTPAVCGTPRVAAARWLGRHEALERGWYAGGVGFVDLDADAPGGELCVALRCGLLHRSRARLYAGAGTVAGSDPASELDETRLKLRTLLSQLTEI